MVLFSSVSVTTVPNDCFTRNLIAHFYLYTFNVGIDREILAMSHRITALCAPGMEQPQTRFLQIPHGLCAWFGSNVNAVVNGFYIAQGWMFVFSERRCNHTAFGTAMAGVHCCPQSSSIRMSSCGVSAKSRLGHLTVTPCCCCFNSLALAQLFLLSYNDAQWPTLTF
jgi:hypothetical protein